MVFFILSESLFNLIRHFEIFASSWLSVARKENMSLSRLKRLLSSANSPGKDADIGKIIYID